METDCEHREEIMKTDYKRHKDGNIYAYVKFNIFIPAKGKDENELIDYAREEFYHDQFGYQKDMMMGGTVHEYIDDSEIEDFFFFGRLEEE